MGKLIILCNPYAVSINLIFHRYKVPPTYKSATVIFNLTTNTICQKINRSFTLSFSFSVKCETPLTERFHIVLYYIIFSNMYYIYIAGDQNNNNL